MTKNTERETHCNKCWYPTGMSHPASYVCWDTCPCHSSTTPEVDTYKTFPVDSLCCNGDYCTSGCDERKRAKVNDLLLSQKQEMKRIVEGMKLENEECDVWKFGYNSGLSDILSALELE